MSAWWESQGEGNTKGLCLKELQFNHSPQMHGHGKSALAICEIAK